MPKSGNSNSNSKDLVLIVDDEIIKYEDSQEDFINLIGVPSESALFIGNYEEALEVIEKRSNIIFCFIDIKIPKNKYEIYDYTSEKSNWGVDLISQIHNIKMFIYSAYMNRKDLAKKAKENSNIIGTSPKPFILKQLQEAISYLQNTFTSSLATTLKSKSFDYSSLDNELSSFLKVKTEEIKKSYRKTLEEILNIGNYLLEVKERLDYGQFYKWMDAELPFRVASATRFMQAAKRFSYSELEDLNIVPSALYKLAETSTPDEAIVEALALARKGEKINEELAKNIKAKHLSDNKSISSNEQIEQEKPNSQEDEQSLSLTQLTSPEKTSRPKQEILAIKYSENAVKDSWWNLAERHQLFCGEPTDKKFLTSLPDKIALRITFLPQENYSLVPSIESLFSFTFYPKIDDLDIDPWFAESVKITTKPHEVIVINYIYYIELLDIVEELDCYAWIAEPDLEKCDRLLEVWRKKGDVVRDK